MSELFDRFCAQDLALQRKDFPATSPWWLDALGRFYAAKRRQLVLRVGRRGGKSSTLSRISVVEALHGEHAIPPGDVGVVAFISTHRDEAVQRIRTIRAILEALGVEHKATAAAVELTSRPIVFKVFTASIAGVSGFTSICVIADEVAKWKDADTGSNPAFEVLSSVGPTMSTMPNAKMFLSSSPLGQLDAHARAFAAGEQPWQCVAYAQTWVANPTLTEEATRALERDEGRWAREYAAIPLEGSSESLFTPGMLDRATRADGSLDDLPSEPGVAYFAAMDPGFVRNAWTFAIAGKRLVDGHVRRSIVCHREWRGTHSKPLNPAAILSEIAPLLRQYRCSGVMSDQYERFALQTLGLDIGVNVEVVTEGPAARAGRYEAIVTHFLDGTVDLPADPVMRSDLLSVRRTLTPNGFTVTIPEGPDGRHGDWVPTVTLALFWSEVEPMTPETHPAPMTPEWEARAYGRLLAENERVKREGPVLWDELPAWAKEAE